MRLCLSINNSSQVSDLDVQDNTFESELATEYVLLGIQFFANCKGTCRADKLVDRDQAFRKAQYAEMVAPQYLRMLNTFGVAIGQGVSL